jgi:LytS/YehU family sensor histidine kinase
MKIVFPIFINIIFVVLFYLFERIEKFKYLNKYIKQLIIGVTFGIISIIGSELGMEISGATMNVRDSAPLSAGLIFGWEAGLIAGIIGGSYRALSVLWGGGIYTALACSISTILAGVVAAILRKFMFDDKKPSWPFAICITVVMEVFHMLMIFLTNLSDANTAFTFVKMCTIPMVILNSLTVGVSVLLVTILSKERILRSKSQEQIAQTFQRWLILSVIIAFISMSIFTYNLQTSMRQHQIEDTFRMSINDVIKEIVLTVNWLVLRTFKRK